MRAFVGDTAGPHECSRVVEVRARLRAGQPHREAWDQVTVLADSDIPIEVARGKARDIVGQVDGSEPIRQPFLYSPVSVVELWADARPNEHEALANLFRAHVCAPIDGKTGRHARGAHG